MHGDGLADDEAIGDEFADGLAAVGVGDLVHFIGVEPDLAFAAVGHGRRQALLRAEVHPGEASCISLCGFVLFEGGVEEVSMVLMEGAVKALCELGGFIDVVFAVAAQSTQWSGLVLTS